MLQWNFACRLNKEISCLLSYAPIYSELFLVYLMQKSALKRQGHFHLDTKRTLILLKKTTSSATPRLPTLQLLFHQTKKKWNSAFKVWSLSHHESFYCALSRIPWKQISQHLSKLLWLVETGSWWARKALLLPQATADKRQGLQSSHLYGMSRSTLRSPTITVPLLTNAAILTQAFFMLRKSSLFFSESLHLLFPALTL